MARDRIGQGFIAGALVGGATGFAIGRALAGGDVGEANDPASTARAAVQSATQAGREAAVQASRVAEQAGSSAAEAAGGAVEQARERVSGATAGSDGGGASEPASDADLADRVRSEIFRADDAPKGSVVVNAEQGIVYLRGEVEDSEWISRLVREAKQVEGVRAVENLLHAPGETAEAKQETPEETERRVKGSEQD